MGREGLTPPMDQSFEGGRFRTTRWSLVLDAVNDPVALDELLTAYWKPIYAYIRRSGRAPEDASDLTQEFVTQRIVAGALLERADPIRGRFRTLVKTSLRNFLIDQGRRDRAYRRAPQQGAVLSGFSLEDIEPRDGDDPGVAFDRQWASTLLSNTIELVQKDCEAAGQSTHWKAFERTVLCPSLGGITPLRLVQLAKELDAGSADRVSAMIQTVRRKFRRAVRAQIEDTVAEPSMVYEEAEALQKFLQL